MSYKSFSTNNFILILLVVASLASCASPRERSIKQWEKEQWNIVKVDKSSTPEWTIYKREIAGTDFLEYKIEGEIGAPPAYCLAAFKQDIYDLAGGSKTKDFQVYKIMRETGDNLLTYVIHREPFPLKDTEMSVNYTFAKAKNETVLVSWKEDWDDETVPAPSRKLSRVDTFRGGWSFRPTTNGGSHAINTVNFDPKKMPMWLVQPMVTKFLVKGLEKLKVDAVK